MTGLVSGDPERGAEAFQCSADEVWRSLHAPESSVLPVPEHVPLVVGPRASKFVRVGDLGEDPRIGDVLALLEERVAQSQADGFVSPVVAAVGGG